MKRITQITVRGLDPQIEKEIRRIAEAEGISLNKAALKLMRNGAGVGPKAPRRQIGNSLDQHIGTWREKEAQEFMESIRSCEQIDPEFWKSTGRDGSHKPMIAC